MSVFGLGTDQGQTQRLHDSNRIHLMTLAIRYKQRCFVHLPVINVSRIRSLDIVIDTCNKIYFSRF